MSRFFGNYRGDGAYSMTRHFTAMNFSDFTEVDFRGAGWMRGCEQLTQEQKLAAGARGELKLVEIAVTSGEVDIADTADPGDNYAKADSSTPQYRIEKRFTNALGVYQQWLKTDGSAALNITIYFDIPSADQV